MSDTTTVTAVIERQTIQQRVGSNVKPSVPKPEITLDVPHQYNRNTKQASSLEICINESDDIANMKDFE